MAEPHSGRSRAQLLHDLDKLNRTLARYRMPPLIDVEAAGALDDLDLSYVVRATGRHVAEVIRALGGTR